MKHAQIALAMVCALVVAAAAAPAEDSLPSARDLYAAAAYEDALSVLNRLRATEHPGEDIRTINQYRAFCLLALGRTADAEQAIEAVVASDPFYLPSDAEVSPRIRTAFADVRRRTFPSIVQDRYAAAKAAYDKKDYVAAEAGFKLVLTMLADPDLASANQAALSDIRTLATGFRDLSATAAIPPPLPSVPTPEPVAPAPPVAARAPATPQIFGPDDANVTPPTVVKQNLPPFTYQLPVPPSPGSIEIVIDEHGGVESAVIRKSIFPRYDAQLVEAAKGWAYKPATFNGFQVKYRKVVNISVNVSPTR